MKNHRKSKRALSPVVASIILIAVTVAVSIAVAAWMGALTIGFMGAEEVRVTNVEFASDLTTATLTVKNTGSTAVTISEAYVGGKAYEITEATIQPGTADTSIVLAGPETGGLYNAGQSYQFKVVSTKGNPFVVTATAPT